MTGFFFRAFGSHNARYLPLIHPPLRIGSVAVGCAARALARSAAIHCGRTPSLIRKACTRAHGIRVPAIVRDRKTKAAKENKMSRFTLARLATIGAVTLLNGV